MISNQDLINFAQRAVQTRSFSNEEEPLAKLILQEM